ncbi:MAG: hypothetical protein ACYDEA_05190 [Candidatus Dormibacteria bacterium]
MLHPAVFTLCFAGIAHSFDLSELPCPRLVRPLGAALVSIGGDDGTVRTLSPDFSQMVRHLRDFVGFVAARADLAVPAGRFGFPDLGPEMLEAYEADLLARFGESGKRVQVFMHTVVRLLRLAGEADPASLRASLAARLGYGTTLAHHAGVPLDAYPVSVLEAIRVNALADVAAIRDRIDAGCQRADAGADPLLAGWAVRENVLWHLARHGPLPPEQFRPLHRVRYAPGGVTALNAELFLVPADLVPMLAALISLTGLEPECAKGLRADCLSSPTRGFVTLSYAKRRAHVATAKTMRIRDGGLSTPGGLIRLVARLTEPARAATGADALWVGADINGLRAFFDDGYEMTHQLHAWANRHHLGELTDRDGSGVRLDLRRLRKTVKSQAYLRSGGVLDDFATGHTKQVAASRYADIGAHAELHDQAVEAGLRQALEAALDPPVVATESGAQLGTAAEPLTPSQVQAATATAQDVFLASCTDFYASPFARSPGRPCPTAVWGCLECPNAVFTERHLPSLAGFARFLEDQREELPAPQWQARYALAHQRLTTGILPAFSAGSLELARQSASSEDATVPTRLLEQLT